MTILIFGANGQVGRACQQEAKLRHMSAKVINRSEVDLRSAGEAYSAIIKHQPTIVINAAAYTAVDKAESEPDTAKVINATSPEQMAKACQILSIPLVQLSTDYVFDGKAQHPYNEQDKTNPQNIYGQTKLQGENAVLNNCEKPLVLRTSWVFGLNGNNFVKTMLQLGADREQLNIVADQIGSPTFANHIAETIFDLAALYQTGSHLPWGVYHLTDREPTTWYKFACEIFTMGVAMDLLKYQPRLNPITTAEYPTPATRPSFSVLDCNKLEALLGRPMKPWHTGLKQVISSVKTSSE